MIKGHGFDKFTLAIFILGMISIFFSSDLAMILLAFPAGRGATIAYDELKNANS